MKKIILFLLFAISITFSQTNINTSFGNVGYVTATLTGVNDTLEVTPNSGSAGLFDVISVVVTSSAGDTINVYTLAKSDTTTWSKIAVIELGSDSLFQEIEATTVTKEFLINDPQPKKVRLVYLSDDGATATVIIQGKYGARP